MKIFFVFLFACPLMLWAQVDTLKPIEIQQQPSYHYYRSGPQYGYTQRYMYDGIEVRHPKDLAPYLLASGDANVIHEYQSFTRQRSLRTTMFVLGGVISVVGTIIAVNPSPTVQPASTNLTYYNGLYYGNGMVYSGNPYASSTERKQINTGGVITAGLGVVVMSVGALVGNPNFHLRRSIQFYNRALKQRGISWQLIPHASLTNSGIGLVGRF